MNKYWDATVPLVCELCGRESPADAPYKTARIAAYGPELEGTDLKFYKRGAHVCHKCATRWAEICKEFWRDEKESE